MKVIDATDTYFKTLNDMVFDALEIEDEVILANVGGQRYIGTGMDAGKSIIVQGTPGNDMACYMNGGKITVHGNGQDAVGNTMNGGEIVIYGHSGDTVGYGMRDGRIFIETNVGCRGGIHMKEFERCRPKIVIGGRAGAYLGEYMAGGVILLLGLNLKEDKEVIGHYCATGMHGGVIYIRGEFPDDRVSPGIAATEPGEEDMKEIWSLVRDYCQYFGTDYNEIMKGKFTKLAPTSARPYKNLYARNEAFPIS